MTMSTQADQEVNPPPPQIKFNQGNLKRFWGKVNKSEDDGGCWEWIGHKDKGGYGKCNFNDKGFRAHRASYIIAYGNIPEGKLICHKCDRPSCIRPDHLFLGTNLENIADRNSKGRQSKGEKHAAIMRSRDLRGDKNPARIHPELMPRGEKSGTAKLTELKVIEIRKRYAAGGTTQKKLGAEYNVHFTLIGYIVNRKVWAHVP